jgi:hypothetical protein
MRLAASRTAKASPIPPLAPVINAVLSDRSMASSGQLLK